MPQSCCVVKCTHYRSKFSHCRLFRFPADPSRAWEWEKNISRGNWKRNPWDRICECHFEEQEFEQHRKDGRKKLLPTAVPSIFPTHCIKLSTRPARDQQQPEDDPVDEEPPAWQLLEAADDHSQPSRSSDIEIPAEYLKQEAEEDPSSTRTGADDASSSGESASVSGKISNAEDFTRLQNGDVSPNSGSQKTGESTASLQRCQQEILLLRQTLHNYKQRAWYMDIVLSSLRKENELLRGALQELSPGQLNHLLDLHGS